MRHLLTFLLLASFFTGYGQQKDYKLMVQYAYNVNPETSPFKINYNSVLLANAKESLYEIKLKSDTPKEMSTDMGNFIMPQVSSNTYYYKHIPENKLLNYEPISAKKFLVEDRLDILDWTLTPETKTVLGYKCQQATAHFRGRDYIAYFTAEVPVQNGPWKFHGLPGLILEVYSIDGMFKLTATELKFEAGKLEIKSPFAGAATIPYKEYVALYNKKYKEVTSYRGENGMTMSMPKGRIEVLVED